MNDRLGDLSLGALEEIGRAIRRGEPDDLSVAGLVLSDVRAALEGPGTERSLAPLLSALRPTPDSSDEVEELALGAIQAGEAGRADDAGTIRDMLLERHPGDCRSQLVAAFLAWYGGDLSAADVAFEAALGVQAPALASAQVLLARAALQLDSGAVDSAENCLAEAQRMAPPGAVRARAAYQRARIAARAGRGEDATSYAVAAIEADPHIFGACFVHPDLANLQSLREILRDRFNDVSITANIMASASDRFLVRLLDDRCISHDQMRRGRDAIRAGGFGSRAQLPDRGLAMVLLMRGEAVERLTRERAAAMAGFEDAKRQAAAARASNESVADQHLAEGQSRTMALDMQSFQIRQAMSGRFHLDKPMEPQANMIDTELRRVRSASIVFFAVTAVVVSGLMAWLLPGLIAKVIGPIIALTGAAGMITWAILRYRADMAELEAELNQARHVLALEKTKIAAAEAVQDQSSQIRDEARNEELERLTELERRFREELGRVRIAADALSEANQRFFHAIDQPSHPQAECDVSALL